MTIETFIESAQTAKRDLHPLLKQAQSEADSRLEDAGARLAEPDRPALVEALESAELPAAEDAREILGQFSAMANPHYQTDGGHLIGLLQDVVLRRTLSEAQAAKVAGAIVLALQGGCESGLIRWPNENRIRLDDEPAKDDGPAWHEALNDRQLEQYAAWIVPERAAEIAARRSEIQAERETAETQRQRLQRAEEALRNLIPEA